MKERLERKKVVVVVAFVVVVVVARVAVVVVVVVVVVVIFTRACFHWPIASFSYPPCRIWGGRLCRRLLWSSSACSSSGG